MPRKIIKVNSRYCLDFDGETLSTLREKTYEIQTWLEKNNFKEAR